MFRTALVAAAVFVANVALAQSHSERREQVRQETERLLSQILLGEQVQSSVSRIVFLGQEVRGAQSLSEALPRMHDPHTRQNIAYALASFGVRGSDRALLELVGDDDPSIRMTALQGLATIKADPRDKVEPLLRDKNLGVRREAAHVLGASGKPTYIKALLVALKDEAEPEARAVMLTAIGEIGDKRQTPVLEGFLKASSETTRFAAAKALCKLGAPAGIKFAQALLTSQDRFERREGLALFEGAKAKDVDKVLRPMLKDQDPTVAATAARILYQGGDAKMLDWLVVTATDLQGDAKLAYESVLELLHLQDDQRKKILAKAGIKAPAR